MNSYFKLIIFLFFITSNIHHSDTYGNEEDSCHLLEESYTVLASEYLHFPIVDGSEHSMADALPVYVCQKIPCNLIKEVVEKGLTIEIIGSPPPILEPCYSGQSDSKLEKIVIDYEKKSNKIENFRRPSFYYKTNGKKSLVISVMAGEDYIKQFTALVSYYIKFSLKKIPDDIVRVTSFPLLEREIGSWTHLDSKFVKPHDIVIIGNVSDFYDYLQKCNLIAEVIEESENFYYKATRAKLGNRTLNFLRVKYSFWGNMAGRLVSTLLNLGASEIIYMSKIATLSDPSHIYKRIYSPTQFALLRDHQIKIIDPVHNPLVEKFPELASGMHLSLPTVMEQNFEVAALAHSVATSLDLEVSNIAKVIADHNKLHSKQIAFIPVHWATDYIRTRDEANLDTQFDLTNANQKNGNVMKKKILERIYNIVAAYLMSTDLVVDRRAGLKTKTCFSGPWNGYRITRGGFREN